MANLIRARGVLLPCCLRPILIVEVKSERCHLRRDGDLRSTRIALGIHSNNVGSTLRDAGDSTRAAIHRSYIRAAGAPGNCALSTASGIRSTRAGLDRALPERYRDPILGSDLEVEGCPTAVPAPVLPIADLIGITRPGVIKNERGGCVFAKESAGSVIDIGQSGPVNTDGIRIPPAGRSPASVSFADLPLRIRNIIRREFLALARRKNEGVVF